MTLSEISKYIDSELRGDGNHSIGLITDNTASRNSIIYISNSKKIPQNYRNFGAILTDYSTADLLSGCNLLLSHQPKWAFAKLTEIFKNSSSLPKEANYHKNFRTGKNVKVGVNSSFGCNVVIEDNVKIGSDVTIGHNVVIHQNCLIGNNVVIDSGTIIGSEGFGNVKTNDNSWYHISHLGKVVIDDHVQIGSNCNIDRGTISDTIINKGVVMDNQIHIAHNVEIGENTAIAAKVAIAGSCSIGKRNMIGGMVGIVDHIKTADDVIISATSTVNKNINEPGVYTGIMPISKHITWKRIALWILKLDKIVKYLNIKKI